MNTDVITTKNFLSTTVYSLKHFNERFYGTLIYQFNNQQDYDPKKYYKYESNYVSLLPFHLQTADPMSMNFGIEINWISKKDVGYLLLRKINLYSLIKTECIYRKSIISEINNYDFEKE